MDMTNRRVAVIGGGIGGVAAATALAQRGAQVVLHEQAPAFAEVGAGIQISVNGQRVLRALGATTGPPAMATVSPGTVFRDGRSGRAVARVGAPRGGPTWYMHRADLLDYLLDAAARAGVDMRLGQVRGPDTVEADLIVAADGTHTVWRSAVDGPVEPRFTGCVAWRALVAGPGRDADPHASLSMARGAHLVSYPLRKGALTNLVAVEERRDWSEESWSRQGDPAEFRRRFAMFGGAVGAAIAAVTQVHAWALHARPVARKWVSGNVALLGDAAHPTLPFMAQGACLALEDAWVLAAALATSRNQDDGLARYAELRRRRAASVVRLAKGNAWRFHMGWPFNWGAYATLALGAGVLARGLESVYGYDATRAVPEDAPPQTVA
jgi:salicylate hydroxylase